MNQKYNISCIKWTSFWNGLGIYVKKRGRVLRNYNPRQNDYRPLRNIGVSKEAIEKVHNTFSRYKEPLLFHKFALFFRKDPPTIQSWTNTQDISDAFIKLFNIFQYNNFETIKRRFRELVLLFEMNRKGEGRKYVATYRRCGSIININDTRFSRSLNQRDERAKYKILGKIKFEGSIIVCIEKKITGNPVYKFIRLSRKGNKINIRISADSTKEIELIRSTLLIHLIFSTNSNLIVVLCP